MVGVLLAIYQNQYHTYTSPFEAVYCFICGRRRVAVARYRIICLVLVNSHLFPLPCGAGSAVPRERFNLSVIILASLLVCPMLGCRHSLLRLSNNFTFFSSGMHIFKHSHFCTFASRGTLPCVLVLTLSMELYCRDIFYLLINLMK